MPVLSVDKWAPLADAPISTRVRAACPACPELRREPCRRDALPEYTRYRDDGCDVHPHCLTCPLPRCRYDEPGGLRALLNSRRDRQIVALRLQGVGVEDLAGRFGLSRRTVFRILEKPEHRRRRNGGNGHDGIGQHVSKVGLQPDGDRPNPVLLGEGCKPSLFLHSHKDPDLHSTKEALHA